MPLLLTSLHPFAAILNGVFHFSSQEHALKVFSSSTLDQKFPAAFGSRGSWKAITETEV